MTTTVQHQQATISRVNAASAWVNGATASRVSSHVGNRRCATSDDDVALRQLIVPGVIAVVTPLAVGFILGPIALALLKRNTDVSAQLVVDGLPAAQEVVVDPEVGLHFRPMK